MNAGAITPNDDHAVMAPLRQTTLLARPTEVPSAVLIMNNAHDVGVRRLNVSRPFCSASQVAFALTCGFAVCCRSGALPAGAQSKGAESGTALGPFTKSNFLLDRYYCACDTGLEARAVGSAQGQEPVADRGACPGWPVVCAGVLAPDDRVHGAWVGHARARVGRGGGATAVAVDREPVGA